MDVCGVMAALVVYLIYGLIVALIIIALWRIGRYFRSAGTEQKLTRMELGKLAEEVHLLREELQKAK